MDFQVERTLVWGVLTAVAVGVLGMLLVRGVVRGDLDANRITSLECSDEVLARSSSWRQESFRVGPVGVLGVSDSEALDLVVSADKERYLPIKAPLFLPRGERVTLEVGHEHAGQVSLLYGDYEQREDEMYQVADGYISVRLAACADHDTNWHGGILVSSPSCVRLMVRDDAGDVVGERQLGVGESCQSD